MICAIYARKSTEQIGVADDQKSVTRQIEHATVYAAKKGWSVHPDHIYADDGISGAEFATRPGFLRLMNSLKPSAPFQALVMSEESRLGREAIETAYALKQLVTGGVRVFFYMEDRERTLDSPTDKIMMSLTAFADELEREKARQRTHDAMSRMALAGHVTGGRVFGFDNFDVWGPPGSDGRPKRSHVERRINEAEAAVVRRIFTLCAEGSGLEAIAKTLNAEGACCPRSQRGRPNGWAPSTVREVLYRELYRGVVVWNRTRGRDKWGLPKVEARPQEQWMRVPMPALAIVPDDLWEKVHQRLAARRAVYLRGTDGRLWGRPASAAESKYLLPGLAKCGQCNGGLIVRTRPNGPKRRAFYYGCSSYHQRGRSICTNNLEVPMEVVDRAVLQSFDDFLTPSRVERVLEMAMEQLRPQGANIEAEIAGLRDELARLDGEVARLAGAVATGGDIPALVTALKDRSQQQEDYRKRLTKLLRLSSKGLSDESVRASLHAKLEDWRGLLQRHVPQARQVLKKMLKGSLLFHPKGEGSGRYYEFTGEGALDKILVGVANPFWVASPPGIEPGSRP